MFVDRGELTEAGDLLACRRGRRKRLGKSNPRESKPDFLHGEYVFLANVLLQLGQYDETAAIAVKLPQAFRIVGKSSLPPPSFAQCGALVWDHASLALAERASLSEGYFALAAFAKRRSGWASPTGSMEAGAQQARPACCAADLCTGNIRGWWLQHGDKTCLRLRFTPRTAAAATGEEDVLGLAAEADGRKKGNR